MAFKRLQVIQSHDEPYDKHVIWLDGNKLKRYKNGIWDTLNDGNGTLDYNDLNNKPSINNIRLEGNITLDTLGIKNINIIDNIESNSIKDALSANQGYLLGKDVKDLQKNIKNKVSKEDVDELINDKIEDVTNVDLSNYVTREDFNNVNINVENGEFTVEEDTLERLKSLSNLYINGSQVILSADLSNKLQITTIRNYDQGVVKGFYTINKNDYSGTYSYEYYPNYYVIDFNIPVNKLIEPLKDAIEKGSTLIEANYDYSDYTKSTSFIIGEVYNNYGYYSISLTKIGGNDTYFKIWRKFISKQQDEASLAGPWKGPLTLKIDGSEERFLNEKGEYSPVMCKILLDNYNKNAESYFSELGKAALLHKPILIVQNSNSCISINTFDNRNLINRKIKVTCLKLDESNSKLLGTITYNFTDEGYEVVNEINFIDYNNDPNTFLNGEGDFTTVAPSTFSKETSNSLTLKPFNTHVVKDTLGIFKIIKPDDFDKKATVLIDTESNIVFYGNFKNMPNNYILKGGNYIIDFIEDYVFIYDMISYNENETTFSFTISTNSSPLYVSSINWDNIDSIINTNTGTTLNKNQSSYNTNSITLNVNKEITDLNSLLSGFSSNTYDFKNTDLSNTNYIKFGSGSSTIKNCFLPNLTVGDKMFYMCNSDFESCYFGGKLTSAEYLFNGASNIENILNSCAFDYSECTNLSYAFYSTEIEGDITIDSKVCTKADSAFRYSTITNLNLENFKGINCDMRSMFCDFEGTIKWPVEITTASSVDGLFNSSKLQNYNIDWIDFSNIKSLAGFYSYITVNSTLPLPDTSNIEDFNSLFRSCTFEDVSIINNLNLNSSKSLREIFASAHFNGINLNLSKFRLNDESDASYMFSTAENIGQLTLPSFGQNTDVSGIFAHYRHDCLLADRIEFNNAFVNTLNNALMFAQVHPMDGTSFLNGASLTKINYLDLGNTPCTKFKGGFPICETLIIPEGWHYSGEDLSYAFSNIDFTKTSNIPTIDVSECTNASYMYAGTKGDKLALPAFTSGIDISITGITSDAKWNEIDWSNIQNININDTYLTLDLNNGVNYSNLSGKASNLHVYKDTLIINNWNFDNGNKANPSLTFYGKNLEINKNPFINNYDYLYLTLYYNTESLVLNNIDKISLHTTNSLRTFVIGTTFKGYISLTDNTTLSKDNLLTLINNMYDYTVNNETPVNNLNVLRLSQTLYDLLTSSEIEIGTNKGWRIYV